MIALWMIYSTVVATILGLAAAVVDRMSSSALRQRRWVWFASLVFSVVVPLWVVVRPAHSSNAGPAPTSRSVVARAGTAGGLEGAPIAETLAGLLDRANARSLARYDTPVVIGWGVAVALALLAYGAATWSLRHRRRSWRATVVDGEPVLLSTGVGPAVIGAVHPEIVVPEWSLALPREQRALMIEHERQHVRARDPLMLHAAALAAVLVPWNLAMWWLNRRLRLAVELDCDARVLAGGRDVGAYGALLLDVCSRRGRPSVALAPALLERTSSLTRRILAMHPAPVRYQTFRVTLGVAGALCIVVLACDMPTPEMLAPDGKDVASQRVYGKIAAAVPGEGIAGVRQIVSQYFPAVARGDSGGSILIVVKSAEGAVVLTDQRAATELARVRAPRDTASGRRNTVEGPITAAASSGPRARERRSSAVITTRRSPSGGPRLPGLIGALKPGDIESVDVSKHAAGVVAPNAVSLIVIQRKRGAAIPEAPANQ